MLRVAWDMPDVYNIVHLNDIAAPESIAYLIKYDSIHGTWAPEVEYADGFVTISQGERSVKIACSSEPDASKVRACAVSSRVRRGGSEYLALGATSGCARIPLMAPERSDHETLTRAAPRHRSTTSSTTRKW